MRKVKETSEMASNDLYRTLLIDRVAINRQKVVFIGHHEKCLGLKFSPLSTLVKYIT